MRKIRYIDLFAGVGGFRYGIEISARSSKHSQGGGQEKFDEKTHMGFDCVYSNEWNKYANSVYRKHYGECDDRDIRTVATEEIPEFDILFGGFPCQSFSIAGKRGGFSDTRGTLFFEIARIIKEKQPRLLLLENVKGLLSHSKGRTFATIISTLDELGYDCQWQVLNSKDFGVPQNRERVYIIGHTRGTPRPEVFPITRNNGKTLREVTRNVSDAQRVYEPSGVAKTLKGLGGGMGAKTGLYAFDKFDEMVVRRLTPIECERLQGFPDNWTKEGTIRENQIVQISDSQRYKMMGNAVTTNVVEEIVKKLLLTSYINIYKV